MAGDGPATGRPIPAFVNPASGSADAARAAVRDDARFALHEVEPGRLAAALAEAARDGHPRVAVAGGDGTIAAGATAAAEHGVELAVLPGGTAQPLRPRPRPPRRRPRGVPRRRRHGARRAGDLGRVNGRAFLNTSAVGAYVTFVRTRERMERWAGYRLASALAAARVWFGLHAFAVVVREGGRAGRPGARGGEPAGLRRGGRARLLARGDGRPPPGAAAGAARGGGPGTLACGVLAARGAAGRDRLESAGRRRAP
jgi:hypothetical protein